MPREEIQTLARSYFDAFLAGDHARTASLIDPQDRVDFQQEFLQALRQLEPAGLDFALRDKLGHRSNAELVRLTPEEFLSLFMGHVETAVAQELKAEIEAISFPREGKALVEYRLAGLASSLELRQAPYGWKIRLRPGLAQFAELIRALTADFVTRAERDRVVPPDLPLLPFKLHGYRTESEETVIEPRFEEARAFVEGFAAVQVMGRWGFIDHTGRLRIPPRYVKVTNFSQERAWVCEMNEEFRLLWALIDREGRQMTDFVFREVELFFEELARLRIRESYGAT